MCGNFGLLSLGSTSTTAENSSSHHENSFHKHKETPDVLDSSLHESMHEVARLNGMRYQDPHSEGSTKEELVNPLKILEAQTACTEIRGGQAGGFSSIEYKFVRREHESRYEAMFNSSQVAVPDMTRVRMVARKRHPLAADLAALCLSHRKGKSLDPQSTITVIGHTRFATSSVNQVSELHPHEWVPFHNELVWLFNPNNGRFEKLLTKVGVHISHNGDFDALEAFSQTMVVDEIGLWLERVLHIPNNTKGDSPKIAGCMDLLRVQGRWGPAARLAYVRCITQASTDVVGGDQLRKGSPNTFPDKILWDKWADLFDKEWSAHINNVIKVSAPTNFELRSKKSYWLDAAGVKQFENVVSKNLFEDIQVNGYLSEALRIRSWSANLLISFIHFTIYGFLRGDLYNAMTELLSRAEGSFGLQVHCTLEPGVVVIASKGQPMSFAFDPLRPIVLFASEAEALAVPVYKSGKWLPERIDLDSHGEIVRLGEPRNLQEGSFFDGKKKAKKSKSKRQNSGANGQAIVRKAKLPYILLDCGIEIRSYSLVSCIENTMETLMHRSVSITSAPIPYDPKVDLVAEDLRVTPAVLMAIDRSWSNAASLERLAGDSLASCLVNAMHRRMNDPKDTFDLIIGGVEVSLWLAENFAADMRRLFPHLNIATTSANKMLGLGEDNPSKVFFSVSDEIQARKIDHNTCVLLISQSGQTFPTLHATRKVAKHVADRLWILTGCFNSKMEQALLESYRDNNIVYKRDRVFNNYSGHRPAEPSSVAVTATWHTLTRLLLHIIHTARLRFPCSRIIHPWEYDEFAYIIQRFFLSMKGKVRAKLQKGIKVETKTDAAQVSLKIKKGNDEMNDEDPELHGIDARAALNDPLGVPDKRAAMMRQASSKKYSIKSPGSVGHKVVMNLSDGCIEDIRSLLSENLIANVSQIVGHDHFGAPFIDSKGGIPKDSTYYALVKQGKAWAEHVNETWHIIVLVAVYLFFSVGLGLPIIGLIGDAILAIIHAGGASIGYGIFAFTPRVPHIMYQQPIGYTLIGLLLQLLDAVFFIYLAKNFTRLTRLIHGRPLAARHGKRTIVIVDNPCVHQLTEIFVSKLFSQSYSFVSVEVHGANGLDHFVHRFTHRVVRGLLIAVGRPDGRMCCLAKSEASALLATKQAAFIRNPDYHCEGNGPEIVTIGHNPYEANLGLSHNIVLHGGVHHTSSILSLHNNSFTDTSAYNTREIVVKQQNRRKFVDEYLYDRLFLAQKPFTTSILRSLRRTMDNGSTVIKAHTRLHGSLHSGSLHSFSVHSRHRRRKQSAAHTNIDEPLPYGVHHIDPSILTQAESIESSVFADFIMANKELLKPQVFQDGVEALKAKSNDPAVRLAFSSKLDSQTRQIQDLQVIVQQFYECRVASLERYLAFCVMFHAMAKDCAKPWFMPAWDIARSQSNLRVATTASPISASGGDSHGSTQEVKKLAHQMAFKLRKIHANF